MPLYGGLSENNDLEKLCIEGTDLLLLELPFPAWNKWHIQEVYNIIAKQDVTPVMAHIERYLNKPKEIEKLDQLISVGAKFQMNAPSFLTLFGKTHHQSPGPRGADLCHRVRLSQPDLTPG